MYNEQAVQGIADVDYILPTNAAAASYNSATPIDMSKFHRAMYNIVVGIVTSTGTLDARLQSCATSNFASNVHNLAGTNITQITANNTIAKIEVRADQVTQQFATDKFVRLNTTVATAAVNYAAVGQGVEPSQRPGNQYEGAIVGQSVVCNT